MDGVVGVGEGLEAFKARLTIVEGGSTDVEPDVGLIDKFKRSPSLTLLVSHFNVGLCVAELRGVRVGGARVEEV